MKNKRLHRIAPGGPSSQFPARGCRCRGRCRHGHDAGVQRLFTQKLTATHRHRPSRLSNVTLTAAQRQNIHLYTVAPSKFHKTIETTGAVDFDNDQATSVLAPFGGPVSRLLVSPGDEVKAGDPLAEVDSPDFAAAISAYRKALATAQTIRRLADMDKDLIQHNGVAQREAEQAQTDAANAEADRDAALQALVSLNVDPQTIKDIQEGRPVSRPEGIIRSPIAGTVVEKLITPGELADGGHHAVFYRGRSFPRLGHGATFRFRPGFGQRRRSGRSGRPASATNNFSGTRGQHLGPGGSRHPLGAGAGGGRKSGRLSEEADVCPRADSGPPGKHRTAGPGFGDFARRREPAVCLCRPARRQLRAAARDAGLSRRRPI